jgi:hypothetical protein
MNHSLQARDSTNSMNGLEDFKNILLPSRIPARSGKRGEKFVSFKSSFLKQQRIMKSTKKKQRLNPRIEIFIKLFK